MEVKLYNRVIRNLIKYFALYSRPAVSHLRKVSENTTSRLKSLIFRRSSERARVRDTN